MVISPKKAFAKKNDLIYHYVSKEKTAHILILTYYFPCTNPITPKSTVSREEKWELACKALT